MKVTSLEIPEVLLLEPSVFGDARGFFMETYSSRAFPGDVRFVQDNLSFSSKGVLRGLHLQHPNDQGKLVMAVTGAVFDVAVDVRVGSPTFGRWVGETLSADNHRQLYVPPGFAHGFCVLSETAHFLYKCTDLYSKESELSVRFDDPDVGIKWPLEDALVSEKDEQAPLLKDIDPARLPKYPGAGS